MQFPYGETITRERAQPALDPYSGEQTGLDWSAPDRLDIDGCGIAFGTSSEKPDAGHVAEVASAATVYAPYGVDVTALDRIVVRGRRWLVDGDPQPFRHPMTGWEAGTEITLTRLEG